MSLQELIASKGQRIKFSELVNERLNESEIRECERFIVSHWLKFRQAEIQSISHIVDGIKIDVVRTDSTNLEAIAFKLNEECGFYIRDIATDGDSVIVHFKKPPTLRLCNLVGFAILFVFLAVACFSLELFVGGGLLLGRWLDVLRDTEIISEAKEL